MSRHATSALIFALAGLCGPLVYFLGVNIGAFATPVHDAIWPTRAVGLYAYSLGTPIAAGLSLGGNVAIFAVLGMLITWKDSAWWILVSTLVGATLAILPLSLMEREFKATEFAVAVVFLLCLALLARYFGGLRVRPEER